MTSAQRLLALAMGLSLLWGLGGCQKPQSDSAQPPSESESTETGNAAHEDEAAHDHDGHDHEGHDDATENDSEQAAHSDMEKMEEGLADLTPEERQSAMNQHICPVTGAMLGTMGTPEKVDVNGKTVWICCDGCREKLLAEPEKYLSKLEK